MTVTTITRSGWLTFAELSLSTGIAEPSLRRYAKSFAQLVQSRVEDRVARFEPRAAKLFEEAGRLYASGLRTEAVRRALLESYSQTFELEARPDLEEHPHQVSGPAMMPAMAEAIDRLAAALERSAGVQAGVWAELREQSRILQARLEALEARQPEAVQKPPRTGTPANRKQVLAIVAELRGRGLGKKAIASELAKRGTPTLSGLGKWHPRSVGRLFLELERDGGGRK